MPTIVKEYLPIIIAVAAGAVLIAILKNETFVKMIQDAFQYAILNSITTNGFSLPF